MSKQDDLHNKIVVFLTRSRKIQDAPSEQRNRWLRDAGLSRYIADAKLNPADGASEFSNKIIAALWSRRADLLAFLQHIAEDVYERGAQGDEEYGELVELINVIGSLPSDAVKTGHWGMSEFFEFHGLSIDSNDLFDTRAEAYEEFFHKLFYEQIWLHSGGNEPTENFRALKRSHSMFLFAPEGYGKTAIRLMLAYYAREERNPPALVVETNVKSLNEQLQENDLRRHLIRRVLDTMRRQMSLLDKKRGRGQGANIGWLAFQEDSDSLAQFIALENVFSAALPVPIAPPPEALIQAKEALYQQDLNSGLRLGYWMEALWHVVRAAGFGAIYLIVDGLEAYLREDYNQQQELIRPLLLPGLIAPQGNIYWRFFLREPLNGFVLHELGQANVARYYYIHPWSAEDLVSMFDRRLAYFSRVGNLSRDVQLIDLCEIGSDAELRKLADCAKGSPRKFLQLVQEICEAHVGVSEDRQSLIARSTLQQHIKEQKGQQREVGRVRTTHTPKQGQRLEQRDLAHLRMVLSTYFDEVELDGLCFDLGIDPENLVDSTKQAKVMSLIRYCERHGILAELKEQVRKLRPKLYTGN
jgi:hypothetical protein